MKRIVRLPIVQDVLAWTLGNYIRLMLNTVRWTHVNAECVEPVLAGDSGAIGLLWHGRIPLSLAVAPQWWRKRTKILISPSVDGEFIARALAMNNFPSIRASTPKPGDMEKMRLVIVAVREAVDWVSGGGALVITPDGPRGPNEVIARGSVQIAKRSGQPVFLMGIAAKPNIRAGSWDRSMLAFPFGRGAVVWEGPFQVARDADDATLDAILADWNARLRAATRRAEALVGLTPD